MSLVVVSFNQAPYLEEALRSILLQNYPHLEVFVADGGSRDGSVDIIRKYEPWLAGWLSEPDRGQSDALNKGFKQVTGEIVNWLCSDDLLMPGALREVGVYFKNNPAIDVLAGGCLYQHDADPSRNRTAHVTAADLDLLPARNPVYQPGCFFRKSVLDRAGPLRVDLHYTMDWELWCRFLKLDARWAVSSETLGVYRVTGDNKSFVGGIKILRELELIYPLYAKERPPLTRWFRSIWLPLTRASHRTSNRAWSRIYAFVAQILFGVLKRVYHRDRCLALREQYWMYGVQQEISNNSVEANSRQ